jgi:hypothetical protein
MPLPTEHSSPLWVNWAFVVHVRVEIDFSARHVPRAVEHVV